MLAYDENGKMREFQEYEQHPVPVPGMPIQCLSPAKKYKFYRSSINKSLHFAQRSLSSSTRGQRVIAQLNLSRE